MKKNTMSSTQTIPIRYSELETDSAPQPAVLPFLSNTDPALLEQAVKKALTLREEKKRD